MTAKRIKWQVVYVRRGYRSWRRAYLSACRRFEVVEEMGGPLGSTWYAYDKVTGAKFDRLYGNLKPCNEWCEQQARA